MEREREISLADIFFKVLFAWRGVIISAVVFALIFAGYAFYKYKNAQAGYEEALANYEKMSSEESGVGSTGAEYITDARASFEGFTSDEAKRVNASAFYVRTLGEYDAYLADSVLMGLDPYDLRIYSRSMTVKSPSGKDGETAIAEAYRSFVTGGSLAQALSEALGGIGEKSAAELIAIDGAKSVDETRLGESILTLTNEAETTGFTLKVILPDGADEAGVKQAVDSAFDAEKKELEALLGAHDLVVDGECTSDVVDTRLADKKMYILERIAIARTNLENLTKGMSDRMLEIVYGTGAENGGVRVPAAPGFSKKYVLLGFLLGGFLAVAFVALKAIFSGKLSNLGELTGYFGLRSLGNLSDRKKRRGLDRLFSSLRHRNEKKMDDATRMDIICSNIELLCEKEEIKKLVLTGTESEKMDADLKSKIASRLGEKGIEVVDAGNICYDMSALRTASGVGYAVVAEIEGVSKYREIEEELEAFKNNEISVLGCIGVGEVPG